PLFLSPTVSRAWRSRSWRSDGSNATAWRCSPAASSGSRPCCWPCPWSAGCWPRAHFFSDSRADGPQAASAHGKQNAETGGEHMTGREESAATTPGGYESEGFGGEPDRIRGAAYWVLLVLGTIGNLVAINQIFNLQAFGLLFIDTAYFYALMGIFLSLVFVIYPAHKSAAHHVPWYDWLLAVLTLGAGFYLAWNGGRIVQEGW